MLALSLRILVFILGSFLIINTILAAIRSFVLPRNDSVLINNWIFTGIRYVFGVAARLGRTYAHRDQIMALYAPVGLVALPIAWLALVSLGYTAIFWSLGEGDWATCYKFSSSSLLTLGSENSKSLLISAFSYSEAGLGLLLLTLLISYLPTMYQAFSRRELVVARLELRSSPGRSATDLVLWLSRSGSLKKHVAQWQGWEEWFVEIEESHTSLPILTFFRSPQPGRSWVTGAGIILDAAALIISAVEQPRNEAMQLCFKGGCLAVNRVSRFFRDMAHAKPTPLADADQNPIEDPQRQDFMSACEQLREAGLKLKPDLEQAWQTYHRLRTRYADALDFLARLTMSPDQKTIGN